jgi:hypothetical protein
VVEEPRLCRWITLSPPRRIVRRQPLPHPQACGAISQLHRENFADTQLGKRGAAFKRLAFNPLAMVTSPVGDLAARRSAPEHSWSA